jgi:hypothetical protein
MILLSLVSVFVCACPFLFGRDLMMDRFAFRWQANGGFALHYKSSYERNFVMRIFIKGGKFVQNTDVTVLTMKNAIFRDVALTRRKIPWYELFLWVIVRQCQHLTYISSSCRMNDELKRNWLDRGLTELRSHHLSGGNEETTESLTKDSRCPGRASNLAPPKYMFPSLYAWHVRQVQPVQCSAIQCSVLPRSPACSK